jgi:hypothetical protein
MNSASPDIREITDDEISDVNGALIDPTAAVIGAGIALGGLLFEVSYKIGRDLAHWCNRRDKENWHNRHDAEKRAADPVK